MARKVPPQLHRTTSRPFTSIAFISPGATASVVRACTKRSVNVELISPQLWKRVGVFDVSMHEQSTPAPLHRVEMLTMKRDAGTHDLHVAGTIATDRLDR